MGARSDDVASSVHWYTCSHAAAGGRVTDKAGEREESQGLNGVVVRHDGRRHREWRFPVSKRDVRAIATYVAAVIGPPAPERRRQARQLLEQAKRREISAPRADTGMPEAPGESAPDGAAIYAGACGICHDGGRTTSSGGALPLALSIAAALPTPRNLIYIIQQGILPPEHEPGRFMPGFDGVLTSEQLAALVAYIRSDLGKAPAWQNVHAEVNEVMREKQQR